MTNILNIQYDEKPFLLCNTESNRNTVHGTPSGPH